MAIPNVLAVAARAPIFDPVVVGPAAAKVTPPSVSTTDAQAPGTPVAPSTTVNNAAALPAPLV